MVEAKLQAQLHLGTRLSLGRNHFFAILHKRNPVLRLHAMVLDVPAAVT